MVTVSIGVNDNDIRTEAKQFANLTALVTQEAIINNQQLGVDIFRSVDDSSEANPVFGYRWLQRIYWTPPEDSDEPPRWLWRPVQPQEIEAEYYFSTTVNLRLTMEDIELAIDDKVAVEKKPELQKIIIKPDIFLMGNGEISPFELSLLNQDSGQVHHRVSGDLLGRIRLDAPIDDKR